MFLAAHISQGQSEKEIKFEQTPTKLTALIDGLPEEGSLFNQYVLIEKVHGDSKMTNVIQTRIEWKEGRLGFFKVNHFSFPKRDLYKISRTTDIRGLDGSLFLRTSSNSLLDESIRFRMEDEQVHEDVLKEDGETELSRRAWDPVPRDMESILPEWEPLALRYHLRKGHDHFLIRTRAWEHGGSRSGHNESFWQKVGKELTDFGGEKVEAHVFKVETNGFDSEGNPVADDRKRTSRVWLSEDGVELLRRNRIGDYVSEQEGITEQEAKQRIGQFEAAAGKAERK